MRNFHAFQIETSGRTGGKLKTFCPQCRNQRRNKRDKSLSVNLDSGLCHCHHCGWSLCVPDESELRRKAQQSERLRLSRQSVPAHFRRPVFNPVTLQLSEPTERWLVETRCIPQSVIAALQLTEQEEVMPQSGMPEKCLCFNYFDGDVLVNVKYRSAAKHFKMVTGAELIPYNVNAIIGTPECIVTEGELDAASFIAIGRTDTVSVPSGANANLTWLDRFVETHFEDKRLIYIAVDTDPAGMRLREELVRRFGPERCRIVSYGPDCKDANEHLQKYGAESLRIALEQAAEIPLTGIFTASDYKDELRALYENGSGPGADSGWEEFDKICTFELKRLVVGSGIPGAGKSEWIDELVLRLCLRHDWRVGYFSPENTPPEYHYRKLIEKITGKRFQQGCGMNDTLMSQAMDYLDQRVCHFVPEEDFTADHILAKAKEMVARRGIRIFVADPLSRFDQKLQPGQTELQYISNLLNRLSNFAVRHQCLVILVAHPRKMNRNAITGRTPRPEMYDINGSSDFYNKADYGLVVDRDDEAGVVRVHVEKVKFKHLGRPGKVSFVYDPVSGRYLPCVEDTAPQTPPEQRVRDIKFDNTCWLPQDEGYTQGELPLAEGQLPLAE